MGAVRWDEIFYHVQEKKEAGLKIADEIEVDAQEIIQKRDSLKTLVERVQTIHAANSALSFVAVLPSINDTEFDKVSADHLDLNKDTKIYWFADLVSTFAETEAISAPVFSRAAKFLYSKFFSKDAISGVTIENPKVEDAVKFTVTPENHAALDDVHATSSGETIASDTSPPEPSVEILNGGAAIESPSSAVSMITESRIGALLKAVDKWSVVGILIGLGVDMVAGAIKGHKEKEKIEEDIEKLKSKRDDIKNMLEAFHGRQKEVYSYFVDTAKAFSTLVANLEYDTGINIRSVPDSPSEKNSGEFSSAATEALVKYSMLIDMKKKFSVYISRHKSASKSNFKKEYLKTAPKSLTSEIFDKYYDYLMSSSDSMKNAKKLDLGVNKHGD